MINANLPPDYTLAMGAEGLRKALDDFLLKAQKDIQFANKGHYILYQLGQQQSLIKVDMSSKPFQFWYYDLLGRPATNKVKDIIVEFLWEKGGAKEWYLQELEE